MSDVWCATPLPAGDIVLCQLHRRVDTGVRSGGRGLKLTTKPILRLSEFCLTRRSSGNEKDGW